MRSELWASYIYGESASSSLNYLKERVQSNSEDEPVCRDRTLNFAGKNILRSDAV